MQNFQKANMLVSFADLTNFANFSKKIDLTELAEFVSVFYLLTGKIIETSGGEVIKFLGDTALIAYSEDKVNQGVKSLITYKQKTDTWLKNKGINSRLIVKAHFGEVMYGQFGTGNKSMNDVTGKTVNIAALTKSNGFAITPQLFRKLDSNIRKLFKKHTPPITYIPLTEHHKD